MHGRGARATAPFSRAGPLRRGHLNTRIAALVERALRQPHSLEEQVNNQDDVVTMIAASLYASRATDDALRAEPDVAAIADEAWDLYNKLERAVTASPRRQGGNGPLVGSA